VSEFAEGECSAEGEGSIEAGRSGKAGVELGRGGDDHSLIELWGDLEYRLGGTFEEMLEKLGRKADRQGAK
jgi:hypothetical protein